MVIGGILRTTEICCTYNRILSRLPHQEMGRGGAAKPCAASMQLGSNLESSAFPGLNFPLLTVPRGWATFRGNEWEFYPDASQPRFPARDGHGAELAQVDGRCHGAARRNSKMI